MTIQEIYNQNIRQYSGLLKQIRIKRNIVTLSKIFTFGCIIFLIYLIITESDLPLFLLGIFCIALFIFLTIIDIHIIFKQRETEELIRINTLESDYLEGKLTAFLTGHEYQNPAHAYSSDLDLFGDDSLFQHLNRTVTINGTEKLVSWLLSLSKDQDIIIGRQQTVAELSELTTWCHLFRAAGKIHPTRGADIKILLNWQKESPFFKRAKQTRLILYIANIITFASWGAAITGIAPWSAALLLSLLQLAVIAGCLKKINSNHRKLDKFIHAISNYLPLVRQINKQEFKSPYMQKIRQALSDKSGNAISALSSLNRIQNKLDQRGNVLLAFILNGLYLQDLHTLIQLDKWKEKYSCHITPWIEAVSQTDALVSMANYRFNHPDYCIPVISGDSLLDTHNAGHPLLKSNQNVTNNFKIESLHQLYVVTGANMAGKSTFLRTIGINLVLAQSGNVVCSSSFAFQPMAIFTSMRTTDNLAKGTSYFHAELLRLRELIILSSREERLFIILDEMLKGTNSVDKLKGSLAFLQKLLDYPISGLVATHDLALGELAISSPEHFFNVCFEITHSGNEISYDYKLHPGVSNTMNATILLKQMGLI